ncbi:hypothetical protein ACS0TY_020099 [Phlomoides rotata]
MDDWEWVIRNQPWHFDNNFFAIRCLSGNEQPSTVVIDRAAFWVRAYDIPPMFIRNQQLRP